jgi:gamma-glutamylputrescine oxidase
MTQSYWTTPPSFEAPPKYDVAIVGAGLTGLSMAYWIKQYRPHLSVVIIESEQVGAGASGRNAGFNTAGSTSYLNLLHEKYGEERAEKLWRFKQTSLRLMREHLLTKIKAEFVQWGSYTLYRDQSLMHQHKAWAIKLSPNEITQVDESFLKEKGITSIQGALGFKHEGCIQPLTMLNSFKAMLESMNVRFQLNTQVSWLEASGLGAKLVTSRVEIEAEKVFLCLNGYLGQFDKSLKNLISPKRAQMISLKMENNKLDSNYYDPAHKVYFRVDPLNPTPSLLVGGMRLVDEDNENDDHDKVTTVIQNALQDYAETLFQKKLPVLARWSGIMGFTENENPIIKKIESLPHTDLVGGYSGHGMGMAFGVAHEAVLSWLNAESEFRDLF